ncbi:hypothetical protein ACG74X_07170 [Marivita sp. S0852]|uniref:hypothetical protein n=1 Tax=Marivita sp. S0852 TaxID=3373893 RepID=UPI003982786C
MEHELMLKNGKLILSLTPIAISFCALVISGMSLKLSRDAAQANIESVTFSRVNCCGTVADFVYEDGVPVVLAKQYQILISNISNISLSITHCLHETVSNEDSGWGGGTHGSNCVGDYFDADGNAVSLPVLLGPGEVLAYHFLDEWKLSEEQIEIFHAMEDKSNFYEVICASESGEVMFRFVSPANSCLPFSEDRMRDERFIVIGTGRGNSFQSKDIRWWLG